MNMIQFPSDTGNLTPGQVYAANSSRFAASSFQEALTDYSVGFSDPENLDVLLDALAPAIPNCARRFEYFVADSTKAFLADDIAEVIRNIGGEFKRVEDFGSMVTDRIHQKGLVYRLDYQALDAGVDREQARRQKVAMLQARLLRADVRAAIAVHDASATNLAKTWGSSANPHKDLRDSLVLGANGAGIRPNMVVFGEGAYDKMLDVFEAQDTPHAGRAADMSKEQLATKLMVDKVETVSARYATSKTAKSTIVGNVVYMYIARPGQQVEDASHIKRFLHPATGGGDWGVYIEEHANYEDITVEHNSLIRATATLGWRKLTIS
jgi:hypothetical protein